MNKWLILLSSLCTVAIGQNAYTWVDEAGQTHYSDRPIPGATEVVLESAQGYVAPRASAAPINPLLERLQAASLPKDERDWNEGIDPP